MDEGPHKNSVPLDLFYMYFISLRTERKKERKKKHSNGGQDLTFYCSHNPLRSTSCERTNSLLS